MCYPIKENVHSVKKKIDIFLIKKKNDVNNLKLLYGCLIGTEFHQVLLIF